MKYPIMRTLVVAAAFTATFAGCGKHAKEPESSANVLTETETETTPEVESVTEEETRTEAESDTEETGGVDPEAVAETTDSGANIAGNAGATDNTGTIDTASGSDSTANLPQTATQPTATPVPKMVTGVSAVANGSYYVGDTLGANDFTVTVLYSDGTYAINPAGYAVAPLTLAGSSNTLTVSYGGVESTFVVNAGERVQETEETTENNSGMSMEEINAAIAAAEESLYGTEWYCEDSDFLSFGYLKFNDDGTALYRHYGTCDDGLCGVGLLYTKTLSFKVVKHWIDPDDPEIDEYVINLDEIIGGFDGKYYYVDCLNDNYTTVTYNGNEITEIIIWPECRGEDVDAFTRINKNSIIHGSNRLYDYMVSGEQYYPWDY